MPDLFAEEFDGLQRLAKEKPDQAVEKIEKESAVEKKRKH